MARMTRYPLPWTVVYGDSDTVNLFHPQTPWIEASKVGKVRCTFETRCLQGDVTVTFAFQTANEPGTPSPAAATDVGTTQDSNGVLYPTTITDIASTTQAKQLIRFGWNCINAAGSENNLVRVGGTFEIEECGG